MEVVPREKWTAKEPAYHGKPPRKLGIFGVKGKASLELSSAA
jgi:hypothetical protein